MDTQSQQIVLLLAGILCVALLGIGAINAETTSSTSQILTEDRVDQVTPANTVEVLSSSQSANTRVEDSYSSPPEPKPIDVSFEPQSTFSPGSTTAVTVNVTSDTPLSNITVSTPGHQHFDLIGFDTRLDDLDPGETASFTVEVRPKTQVSRDILVEFTAEQAGKPLTQQSFLTVSPSISPAPATNTDHPDSIISQSVQLNSTTVKQGSDRMRAVRDDVKTSTTVKSNTASVSGTFQYDNTNGNSQAGRGFLIEVYDSDDSSGDDLIATTRTDSSGSFTASFDATTEPGENSSEVYVLVYAENHAAEVTDSAGNNYAVKSKTIDGVKNGDSVSLGTFAPQSNNQPYQAADWSLDARRFTSSEADWNRSKIQIKWPDGTWAVYYYAWDGSGTVVEEYISLPDRSQYGWNRETVYHEYGHAAMTNLYDRNVYNMPEEESYNSCHVPWSETDNGFALSEGFAEFFASAVYQKPALDYNRYGDIETNEWYNIDGNPLGCIPGDSGDMDGNIVEGSYASIWWDMIDSGYANDENLDYSFSSVLLSIENNHPQSMRDFISTWSHDDSYRLRPTYYRYGIDTKTTTVRAFEATSVGTTSASVSGYLVGLGGQDTTTVGIRYWPKGSPQQSTWAVQVNKSSPGELLVDITGLQSGTTYIIETAAKNDRGNWVTDRTQFTLESTYEVTLTTRSLSPDSVTANTTNDHTLAFEALNVSDDGDTDTFTVTIPSAATLESANDVTVTDANDDTVSVDGLAVSDNTITIDVSPDSSADVRNLTVETNITVTAPNVSNTTSTEVSINISDSNNGADGTVTTLTVEESADPAFFEVSGLSPTDITVTQGDTLNVSGNVTNTGDVIGTQTVEFRVNGTVMANKTVSLNGSESMTVEFTSIDTSDLALGSTTHGVYTEDDNQTAPLTIEESSASGQQVSVVPATQTTSEGETVTYDVVFETADSGVGSYNFTLTSANASVAQFTDVTLNGDPGVSEVNFTTNGSRLSVDVALADTNDTGSVTLATVSVKSINTGTTDLALSVGVVADEQGNSYTIAEDTGTSINVTGSQPGPGDVTGNGDAATDPDGDGQFEDINGDGSANVADVQALFAALNTIGSDNASFFDFNDDGNLNVADVQALFTQMS